MMAVKKTLTVSIRVRKDTYARFQQAANDAGLKGPDMFDKIMEDWAGTVAKDCSECENNNSKDAVSAEPKQKSSLPEFDVDGNKVGDWIRNM
tara:strand:+ start:1217 stop:1492 length:276 start_codon:yes stop_codon:yes gene_type:complete